MPPAVVAAGSGAHGAAMAVLVSLALIPLALLGLSWLAKSDLRRFGAAGLAALEEEFRPRAAEHQRLDQHAAGKEDDDAPDDQPPR